MIRNITLEDLIRIDTEFNYRISLCSIIDISFEMSKIRINDNGVIEAFIIVRKESLKDAFGINPKSQEQDKNYWEHSYRMVAQYFNKSIVWAEDDIVKFYEALECETNCATILWFNEVDNDLIKSEDIDFFFYTDYDENDEYYFVFL